MSARQAVSPHYAGRFFATLAGVPLGRVRMNQLKYFCRCSSVQPDFTLRRQKM